MKNKTTYIIAIIFIWIGFVAAISFMEAWLKFQAPGITTELGLGIGQLVFKALNRVEIVCALIVIIIGYPYKESRMIFIPIAILIIQTLWVLPSLNDRANLIMSGVEVPKSIMHLWYVLLEVAKEICLIIYGIMTIKSLKSDDVET